MGDNPAPDVENNVGNEIQPPRQRGVFIPEKHLELLFVFFLGICIIVTIVGEWFAFYHYKPNHIVRWLVILSSTVSQVLALPYVSWTFIKGYSYLTTETLKDQLQGQNEVQNRQTETQINNQNIHNREEMDRQIRHTTEEANRQNRHTTEEANRQCSYIEGNFIKSTEEIRQISNKLEHTIDRMEEQKTKSDSAQVKTMSTIIVSENSIQNELKKRKKV